MNADPTQGIFETLLVRAGRPVELELHLQRLARSLATLYGGEQPPDLPSLVLERACEVELGRERVTVVPADGRGFAVDIRLASVDPADIFPSWERAVSLLPGVIDGGLGDHKWADRRALEPLEAAAGATAVPLLLDEDNTVLEASRGNIFIVEGDAVATPGVDGRVLPGVTRGRVLDLAAALGLARSEEPIDLDRLFRADELFLTGAVRGVEPVRSVEGLRTWKEGDVTRRVSQALQRAWAEPTAASPSGSGFPSRA